MTALTLDTAPYVIDETVTVMAFDQFSREEPMYTKLFKITGSSKHAETRASMGGIGDFQPRTEFAAPSTDTPTTEFKRSTTHDEKDLMLQVDRKVVEDDLFDTFTEFGIKLGQSHVRTVEKSAAAIFENANSSALAEDSVAICGTHTSADGSNSQSNKGISTLNSANLSTTRTSHKGFTDYRGERVAISPGMLLVGDTLEDRAYEIVLTQKEVGTANNTINRNAGRWMVAVWPYITGYKWFTIDFQLMMRNLFWYWRMPLEIFGNGDLMTGTRSIAGYYRSHGVCYDWRWVYGQFATS